MNSSRVAGYVYGLLTALCFAISPVFIRLGLVDLPYPVWGTATGMALASMLHVILLVVRGRRLHIALDMRRAFGFQVLAGVTAGVGIALRNVALSLAPVVVVTPLAQTVPVFTVILAALFLGREDEPVTAKLVLGILFVLAGSTLVILGRNA